MSTHSSMETMSAPLDWRSTEDQMLPTEAPNS